LHETSMDQVTTMSLTLVSGDPRARPVRIWDIPRSIPTSCYKTQPVTGTINTATGLSRTVLLRGD